MEMAGKLMDVTDKMKKKINGMKVGSDAAVLFGSLEYFSTQHLLNNDPLKQMVHQKYSL